jgi:hypothetical protein
VTTNKKMRCAAGSHLPPQALRFRTVGTWMTFAPVCRILLSLHAMDVDLRRQPAFFGLLRSFVCLLASSMSYPDLRGLIS